MADSIQAIQIFSAEVIAASGSATSIAIPCKGGVAGYFSLQFAVTGTGTCKFEALCSLDDTTYIDSTEVDPLIEAVTASTGDGSNGKDIINVTIPTCTSFKIKCTETGTANAVTVTAYVGVQ